MEFKVGQDIESICGKCGDVWHVVVAMKGDRIAKVQCKQCMGYHRHKPVGGVAPTARAAGGRSKAAAGSKSGRRTNRKAAEPEGPLVQPAPDRPPRAYNIKEAFQAGDTLNHPTFGTGVVEQPLEGRKIQVFFPMGRKVLAHQR